MGPPPAHSNLKTTVFGPSQHEGLEGLEGWPKNWPKSLAWLISRAYLFGTMTNDSNYCSCGRPLEDDSSTCGHTACEEHALGWGTLELRRDSGGWRHYLHNIPVHCGQALEVEALSEAPHRGPRQRFARYESPLAFSDGEPPAWLFYDVGELPLQARGEGLRLRWPDRSCS